MNRKQFLSRLGIGAAVAVVAPQILASQPEAVEPALPVMVDVSRIPKDMTLDEFLRIWKEQGVLVYDNPYGPDEMLAMQDEMQKTIANMPISQWGDLSQIEQEAALELKRSFEHIIMFGEPRKRNRDFYTGGLWNSML